MRLVWAALHYPPDEQGGSAESVRIAAEAMVRAGHEVTVITPAWQAPMGVEVLHGVEVVRTTRRRLGAALISAGRHAELLHAQDRQTLVDVAWAARRLRRPWLVTLRDVGLLCPIATCLLTRSTVPEDCGQRKLWQTCGPAYRRQYGVQARRLGLALGYEERRMARCIAELASVVLFVSEGLRRVFATAGFPRRAMSRVVYSPVEVAPPVLMTRADTLRRRYGHGLPLVLFVGKPSLGKGWEQFVAAAADSTATFVHVGPCPTVTSERVLEVGSLPRAGVLGWMRAADVVCVPSQQHDALPRVALEAAMQERPIVGTRVGGIPEIVEDGTMGLLVDQGERLGPALGKLLGDLGTAQQMGRVARVRTEVRFNAGSTTDALWSVYDEVRWWDRIRNAR